MARLQETDKLWLKELKSVQRTPYFALSHLPELPHLGHTSSQDLHLDMSAFLFLSYLIN